MKHPEQRLPKQVDAFKLTQQSITLEGLVSTKDLPRLAEVLSSAGNTIDLHPVLNFVVDDEGYRSAQGHVHAVLPMTCQRCLQVMPYEVQADIHWAFVATDEAAKKLPAHLDPVMLSASGYVDLHEMLEEELLLNVPITVFHEDCEGTGVTKVFGEIEAVSDSTKTKPFMALADLLKSGDIKKGR
jgi:uncharacterized protein